MTEGNVIQGDFTVTAEETVEAPTYHPILEVWREVLKPAAKEATKKVTAGWASRMVQSYTGLTFADMVKFRDAYFGKIAELNEILLAEIASDPECLLPRDPAEDVELNATHYQNLILQWQMAILNWELAWDTEHPDAAVELAAISEVHKMFFAEAQGLTAFLDNIKFEFTEADQQMLADALNELREEAESE